MLYSIVILSEDFPLRQNATEKPQSKDPAPPKAAGASGFWLRPSTLDLNKSLSFRRAQSARGICFSAAAGRQQVPRSARNDKL
jgi:hypothetical protein